MEAAYFVEHGLRVHICGVGMAECAANTARLLSDALLAGRLPDLVVLAGIAGTCIDKFETGDTVAVKSETVADLGRRGHDGSFTPLFQKTYTAGFIPESIPVAQSQTVSTAGGVLATDGMEIENMEGAAFFAVCERFGVRAMEVRTISNRTGDPVTAENLDLAARRLAAALAAIISPNHVGLAKSPF